MYAIRSYYGIRFVGPNGLALADTASGLCLPFVPSFPVRPGGFSLISQSGGLGLFLWNLLESEHRITSYNVCYTKLLRLSLTEASEVMPWAESLRLKASMWVMRPWQW